VIAALHSYNVVNVLFCQTKTEKTRVFFTLHMKTRGKQVFKQNFGGKNDD
jgi:hypothetical protein